MKPPVRRRSAPLRFQVADSQARPSPCAAWSPREKLLLLKALQKQSRLKEANVEALQELLPQKNQAQIVAFIHMLKGRVAREAVRKEYRRYQEEKKIKESQVLAPIEVWISLAEKVSYNLEEAITAAFSQTLTIAATEPISLLHSVPRKPTRTTGRKILDSSSGSQQKEPSLHASQNIPETTTGSSEALHVRVTGPLVTSQSQDAVPSTVGESTGAGLEEFNVDFEKIYKYLSTLTQGGKVPELSCFESAVMLDLLMSLPEELIQLDCASLNTHMYESYNLLTSPWSSPEGEGPKEGPEQEECAGTIPPTHSARGSPEDMAEAKSKGEELGMKCTFKREVENGSEGPRVASNLWATPEAACLNETGKDTPAIQSKVAAPKAACLNETGKENPAVQTKGPQWKEIGICPLNSFLIPVQFVSQTVKY
ncbi:snRNA-activating protein complex subunit 2 [Rhinatrema bivittatum]|uniref:snRNA-activating protein complex subunit 2 n=1 Tax=Rhinatrema bivittatum TaxID=194408 RepID=UPI00112D04A1|nr:snRNA-activating protein complex subunit 2 [Rhinatrema bivittatum]